MEPESQPVAIAREKTSGSLLKVLWDKRTARILFTMLAFATALFFLYAARETLVLFLFAILFAYFLAPLVEKLERPWEVEARLS